MSTQAVNILINGKNNTGPAFAGVRGGLAKISSAIFSMKGALGGLAAGLALRQTVSVLSDTAEEIDKIAKTAARLDIATESLIGFQHAAGLSGASEETLNKAIEKQNVNIGRAVQLGGSYERMFENVGLKSQELANMGTDKAFLKIADAIAGLPTPAQRAAAAADIFGRSGVELINTLSLGSDKLKEITQDAIDLGFAYSAVDAAKVEAANDAIKRMGMVWEGLKNTIVIDLAPVIEALANQITTMAKDNREQLKAWVPSWESVAGAIGIVADVVDVFSDSFRFMQAIVTGGIANQIRAWANLGTGIESIINLMPGLEVEFTDTLTGMADELDKLAKEQWANARKEFEKAPPSEGIKQWFADLKKNTDDARIAMMEAAKEKERLMGLERGQNAVQGLIGAGKGLGGGAKGFAESAGGVFSGIFAGVKEAFRFSPEEQIAARPTPPLQATEGRFLTRGRGSGAQADPAVKLAQKAESQRKEHLNVMKELRDFNAEIADAMRNAPRGEIADLTI